MSRLVFLDIFASIGILLVIIFHLSGFANVGIKDQLHFFVPMNLGNIAILYFFFRSGYGLYNSRKDSWLLFFKNRLVKIIPALAITTILTLSLSFLLFDKIIFTKDGNINLITFFSNLFGIQSWFNVETLNISTWFISTIIFFYLLFPLIFWVIQRNNRLIKMGVPLMVIALLFLFNRYTYYLPRYYYYFIVFLAGILIAKYKNNINVGASDKVRTSGLIIYIVAYFYVLIRYRTFFEHFPVTEFLKNIIDILIIINCYYIFSSIDFGKHLEKLFYKVSDHSYYLFLVHYPVIKFLNAYNNNNTSIYFLEFAFIIILSSVLLKKADTYIRSKFL